MVINYYLASVNFKIPYDPCTNARARIVNAHTRDKTCARARLELMRTHLCANLREIFNFSLQDSN